MFGAFQSDGFQKNAFQIITDGLAPEPDNGWLGGTFNDPYYESAKRKEAIERQEAIDELIRLKLEANDLRQQEIDAMRAEDKQTKRQLLAMQRRQRELFELIADQQEAIRLWQKTLEQRNKEVLILLELAYPWMNFNTGGTMH